MNARHCTVMLAIGTTLAIGAPVAQAQVSQSARIAPANVSGSSASSAAGLNATALRWKAIGDAYLKQHRLSLQHQQKSTSEDARPDDRAGTLGPGTVSDPTSNATVPSDAYHGRGPLH
jgi:hypothetical protein